MLSRQIERAGPVRAIVLALLAAASFAHAAPLPETRSLKEAIARNAALPAAPHIGDDDFSRRSRLRDVKLSPDGAFVSFVEIDGQSLHLNLMDARTRTKKRLLTTTGRQEVHWAGDSKALFIDSGDGLSVLPIEGAAGSKVAAFDRKLGQQFVAVDLARPRAALAEEFDRATKVYRLSRVGADGERELLYEGRKLDEFLLDEAGQLAFIRTLDEKYDQIVSRKVGGKWIEVTRCKRLRACNLVSGDQQHLKMVVNHADDRKAFVQLDLAKQVRRVLHTDPAATSDLRTVVTSPTSQQPLFALYDMPQRRLYGLTHSAKTASADITRRFPDNTISIGASEAAGQWLLSERGARLQQERFWLYDRKARTFSEILADERQLGNPLPEQHLAAKIPLRYRASDGAVVHGYLSLPPGKPAASVPMLTMVHGGPWTSFDNNYTALVQLLVNRGVAVFQPNFRASTGYGDKYMLAPKADFGNGRAQADIIEGVRWLLANGVGDSKRLAIMGDSFGGYATLLALTNEPDLFQFGMATVPPPDFARTLKLASDAGDVMGAGGVPFSVTLAEMGIHLGDTAAMKRIADAAPAAHPGKVTKPLLLIAGGKDDKVEIAAVTDYVARLQGLGKPVSLLVDPDEGHNPRKPIVRQAYTHLLQQMLHKHLGGPAVSAPSPELANYLDQAMKASAALK
ncbi:alpha/beta hydrolase family protein [Massilia sp. GCM10020059]|uniref:Prolyl oligopeptidase family serine peptidase n=1 Tax=Massilia agrisoli TaxID=2892444 RepID=A0ABS8IR93_9BURK|nr:prolyl oligopeptidase family serine peptidase [Massilia agrisoli]MCC6071150.1 prolyl oligopeptidase family serine peptidase [Massilia agrisoli]